MGRYFGTDGIRGKANETLDVQRAFQVGRYLGYYFSRQGKGRILVGKDTRLSSGMFENAIAAGASASGADVYLLGYCPTPSVAYLVKREQFSCGVMISASHNPYYDNGIKVFSQAGIKLSAEIEALVEDYIDGLTEIPLVSGDKIGQVIRYDEGLEHYLDWLESLFDFRLEQFHLALDLANGSATTTAEKLLRRMGAHCTVIHSEPNGVNINTKCGSTHPESLQELMKSGIFDLGLAFDGDADRLIAVDPQGNLINGDYVLYICGKYLKENGLLHGNTVVSTVMANLGFFKAMEQLDIATESTQVGDKGELAAIKTLFGVHPVAITSTKSATGHLLGAAGGIEAIFTIQALRDQMVPPTLNLHHPDEDAAGMNLVALQARPQKMRYALSNGFGFGGVNASLLLKRWQ